MPTGQGLEVGVVLLPDLLLDVRRYNLETKKPVFVVGGRAARMALRLLHLLGERRRHLSSLPANEDGQSGPAPAGERNCIRSSHRSLASPFLEYVLLLERQPRCAIRDTLGEAVHSSPMTAEDEVGPNDLNEPKVRQMIQRRPVRSASRPLRRRISTICSTSSPAHAPDQGLFVDSRMSDDPQRAMGALCDTYVGCRKDNRKALNKIAGGVFAL